MSAWIIQRTAPCEPTSFWGLLGRWILRRRTGDVCRIPEAAMRFPDYDAAFDMAAWLRTHQPLAHGEVIAVVDEPEKAGA